MKITSLATLQKFTNVSKSFSYEKVNSYEQASITKYLERWFSTDILDQVFGFHSELPDSIEFKAYQSLMYAHVAFTMFEYSHHGEVVISDLGITRSENEQTKTAYANQVKMYRDSQEDNGYTYVNNLINIFDSYIITFPEWQLSPGYAERTTLLIKTAKEFNGIQRLYRMNTTFIEIIPSIKEGQDLHLNPYFGKTLIDSLIANATLTANQQIVRGYLITALVNLSMGISMKKGLVKLTPTGVMVIGHDSNTANQLESPAMPENTTISHGSYMETGKRYIDLAYKHAVESEIITPESYTPKRFWT